MVIKLTIICQEIKRFEYTKSNFTNVPEWSKSSTGYQIYIDSFRNGNTDNDPIFNEFGTDDFLAPTGELRSGTKKSDLVLHNGVQMTKLLNSQLIYGTGTMKKRTIGRKMNKSS